MLKAKDFRRYARESLRGRWLKAGGVGLVAGLFGGAISSGWSSGSSGGGAETGSSSAAGSEVLASLGSGPDVPCNSHGSCSGIASLGNCNSCDWRCHYFRICKI